MPIQTRHQAFSSSSIEGSASLKMHPASVVLIAVLTALPEMPCCPPEPPEPNRLGRCQLVKSQKQCKGGPRSHTSRMCPVACGRCAICTGHALYSVYEKLCGGDCVQAANGSTAGQLSQQPQSQTPQPQLQQHAHGKGRAARKRADGTQRIAGAASAAQPEDAIAAAGGSGSGDNSGGGSGGGAGGWRLVAKWIMALLKEDNQELRREVERLKGSLLSEQGATAG